VRRAIKKIRGEEAKNVVPLQRRGETRKGGPD